MIISFAAAQFGKLSGKNLPELFTISGYPNLTRKARVVCGLLSGGSNRETAQDDAAAVMARHQLPCAREGMLVKKHLASQSALTSQLS
jgi:hypothetical protein